MFWVRDLNDEDDEDGCSGCCEIRLNSAEPKEEEKKKTFSHKQLRLKYECVCFSCTYLYRAF